MNAQCTLEMNKVPFPYPLKTPDNQKCDVTGGKVRHFLVN